MKTGALKGATANQMAVDFSFAEDAESARGRRLAASDIAVDRACHTPFHLQQRRQVVSRGFSSFLGDDDVQLRPEVSRREIGESIELRRFFIHSAGHWMKP